MEESILEAIMWDRLQTVLGKPSKEEQEVIMKIRERGSEEELRRLFNQLNDYKLEKKLNDLLDETLEDLLEKDSVGMEKHYKQRI